MIAKRLRREYLCHWVFFTQGGCEAILGSVWVARYMHNHLLYKSYFLVFNCSSAVYIKLVGINTII